MEHPLKQLRAMRNRRDDGGRTTGREILNMCGRFVEISTILNQSAIAGGTSDLQFSPSLDHCECAGRPAH